MSLFNIMTRRPARSIVLLALAVLLAACAAREEATDPDGGNPAAQTGDPRSAAATGQSAESARRESEATGSAANPGSPAIEADATDEPSASSIIPGRLDPAQTRRRENVAGLYDRAAKSQLMVGQSCCPGPVRSPAEPLDRENYGEIVTNPVRLVSEQPVSTFSIDVDTGAYSNVRRMLNEGRLPPQDAVRVEELINYFDYAYPSPADRDRPFSVNTQVARAPWNADRLLLQVGIRGYEVPASERKASNLVFLVDVSGSMQDERKLPLLRQSLKLLTRQLTAADRVSLVAYAGGAGIVLEPTPGDQQAQIAAALERLTAGGSTNGAGGIRAAYAMARQGFVEGGINRILLATDGDFNVGTVDFDSLIDLVERERETGVSLTTLGFGAGNYNDQLMERLADAGNGNHAYIDNLNEGRKVLVEQLTATLQTIAKDVKIQVEFNPAVVAEYRLIGYENRMLRREDFNNDRIDAGEVGAGHTVTALYELALVGSEGRLIDPLRYGSAPAPRNARGGEAAFVRLRYKAPDGDASQLVEIPVRLSPAAQEPGGELAFAAAVAAFGQLLRGGEYLGDFGYADILALAGNSRGPDPHGYRGEFLGMVRLADSISVTNAIGQSNPPQARR